MFASELKNIEIAQIRLENNLSNPTINGSVLKTQGVVSMESYRKVAPKLVCSLTAFIGFDIKLTVRSHGATFATATDDFSLINLR
jgi:hypothetical protein